MKTLLIILYVLLIGCNQKKNSNISFINKEFKIQNKEVFDSTKIASFFIKFPKLKIVESDVTSFYQNKKFTYVWFDGSKINQQAHVLITKIENITLDGLSDKNVYLSEFTNILKSKKEIFPDIETELMLSSQYFIYSKRVWSGLSEKISKSINWHLPRKKLNYNQLLDSIVSGNLILQSPPIYKQYSLLKKELINYQNIKLNIGFPLISKKSSTLKIGDTSVVLLNVKKWLLLSKDLQEVAINNVYDTNLQTAIKKIQSRFGQKINGEITTSLINQMNVSIDERIQQITLNMERCRWLPIGNKTDYLVINIPEYKLHAYEKDSLIWSMNVVVGKVNHKTVIFADKIEYVVFSPYWNIPKGILRKEVLPGIARNKNYLSNHNMEWFNGNVRQKPGPENSLGLVKFLFPNSYDIYLHDTPTKSLFDNSNRANSHGCIRLENAEKMANYLLKNDADWNADKIKLAMNDTIEKKVKVKKQQAVFIVYLTCFVASNGQLNFRKDIYNRDKKLTSMILNN